MITKPFPPKLVILDIGPLGHILLTQIQDQIHNACDFDREADHIALHFHEQIMADIVRMLDQPPARAIELITTSFPRGDEIRRDMAYLHMREFDVFISLIREGALAIYQKIRQQIGVEMNTLYALKQIGIDFLLIEKSHFPF